MKTEKYASISTERLPAKLGRPLSESWQEKSFEILVGLARTGQHLRKRRGGPRLPFCWTSCRKPTNSSSILGLQSSVLGRYDMGLNTKAVYGEIILRTSTPAGLTATENLITGLTTKLKTLQISMILILYYR